MRKRLTALLLIAVIALTLGFAGCIGGGGGGGGGKTKKDAFKDLPSKANQEVTVGVILNEVNENTAVVKDYLNNEIGPSLQMKFEFSEVLKTEDARITFIENLYVKGAVGIINLDSSAAKSVIEKCNELGLYCHNQKSAFSNEDPKKTACLGNCGASTSGMEDAYKEAMGKILDDGENHNVVLYSCAATGKQAESHYTSTVAVLNAMKEKYNLNYGDTVENIAQSDRVGELSTGNPNVKIYFVSGLIRDNIVSALQTGAYDIYACVAGYEEEANVIDLVEKEKKMDIKIVATASIEARTQAGFNTLDSNGKAVLDHAIINPLTIAYAINAVAVRNAVDGYASMYRDAEGNAVQLYVNPWLCSSKEDYAGLAKLDKPGTWVISGAEARSLCKTYNSSATLKDSEDLLAGLKNVEELIARKTAG